MFGFLRSYFSNDLAIDLGTANTLIYVRGKGIVLDEPSVVAIRQEAVPTANARSRRSARRPRCSAAPGNIEAIRPMKDGVIADFTVTEQMLSSSSRWCIRRVCCAEPAHHHLRALRSTQVERRAIKECSGRRVAGVPDREPMAAAIGAACRCPKRQADGG
jgi:rod shape-determining protein MreB